MCVYATGQFTNLAILLLFGTLAFGLETTTHYMGAAIPKGSLWRAKGMC